MTPAEGQRHEPIARLRGPNVVLRPINVEDYTELRAMELSEDLAFRWRHRGKTPGPEEWVQTLWGGVLAQYLVCDLRDDGRPIGIAAGYGANQTDGYVHLAAARFNLDPMGGLRGTVRFVEGCILFIDHLFRGWPFRKVYLETLAFNAEQFGSAVGDLFVEEGRLAEHRFLDGVYWDQVTYALTRATWMTERERLLRHVQPGVLPARIAHSNGDST